MKGKTKKQKNDSDDSDIESKPLKKQGNNDYSNQVKTKKAGAKGGFQTINELSEM